jgi:hypothetical protein
MYSSQSAPKSVVQSFPVSRCLLPAGPNVTRRHRHSNSNLNCTARDRLQHPMLQALVLLHRVQDLPIHDLYNCWLISCSFSAAHPLNVLMPMHNRHKFNCKDKRRPMRHRRNHSTFKVNHKANPRLRRHHHRLSPTPPPHPRHLLLLMFILPRQVQQASSHGPCHCGLVSFSSSAVHLSRMQTDTNTAHRLHTYLIFESDSLCTHRYRFVHVEYLISQLPQSRARFKPVMKPQFYFQAVARTCPGCQSKCCTLPASHPVLMCLDAHNSSKCEAREHQDIGAHITASPPIVHNFPLPD